MNILFEHGKSICIRHISGINKDKRRGRFCWHCQCMALCSDNAGETVMKQLVEQPQSCLLPVTQL